jgi:hypothetical protein
MIADQLVLFVSFSSNRPNMRSTNDDLQEGNDNGHDGDTQADHRFGSAENPWRCNLYK